MSWAYRKIACATKNDKTKNIQLRSKSRLTNFINGSMSRDFVAFDISVTINTLSSVPCINKVAYLFLRSSLIPFFGVDFVPLLRNRKESETKRNHLYIFFVLNVNARQCAIKTIFNEQITLQFCVNVSINDCSVNIFQLFVIRRRRKSMITFLLKSTKNSLTSFKCSENHSWNATKALFNECEWKFEPILCISND